MDPADYYDSETRSGEPMEGAEGAGSEVNLASVMEVGGGEPGGRVLSKVGGTVAAVLEKAVVGALARAVRAELGKVLVSKFLYFLIF